jgi:hypothetical protein
MILSRRLRITKDNKDTIKELTTANQHYVTAASKKMKKKEHIPLFKTWTYWYILVVFFLALLIVLFYLLTRKYA